MTATALALSALAVLLVAVFTAIRALVKYGRKFPWKLVSIALLLQILWSSHLALHSPANSSLYTTHLIHGLVGVSLALGSLLWVYRLGLQINKDIRTREQLAGSESAWQLLFDKSSEATIILDASGRFVQANDQACLIFGFSRQELLQKTAHELVHPDDLKELPLQIGRSPLGRPAVTNRRLRHQDGHFIHCEIRGVDLPDGRYLANARDITERKRAEHALQESSAVMAHASRLAHLGFFTWDLGTDVVTCTDEIRRLLGLQTGRTMYSGDIFDRTHHEDLERLQWEVNRSIVDKRQFDHEFRIQPLNGQMRHVRATGEMVLDHKGDAIKVIGVLQDITDQKFQEQALRDSEERFRRVFEDCPLGICTVSLKGQILSSNRAFGTLLGYTPDELASRTIFDLVPRSEVPQDIGMLSGLTEPALTLEQRSVSTTKQLCRRDGRAIWVNLSATSVIDASGAPLYGIGIVEDVTAKRQADETLRELLASMKHAAKLARIGHLTWNFKSDVVIASDEIYRRLGLEPGTSLCSGDLFARTHPEDIPRIYAVIERAVSEHGRIDCEYRALLPDGETLHLHGLGDIEFDSHGEPDKVLLTVQDITDRKLSEHALRASEEQYRVTFETTGAATVLIEEDIKISLVNAEFERLSGYSREEIEGKMSWTTMVDEKDLERMLSLHHLRRADSNAATKRYEFCMITRSGERREILLTIELIPGTRRSVASLVDITLIRRTEEKFLKAFKANPAAIAITRLRDGEFIEVNETFEKLSGFRCEALIGRKALELGLWSHPDERQQVVQILLADGHFRDRESLFTARDGRKTICRYSAEIIELGGEVCAVFTLLDLTESLRAEAALRESEERYRKLYMDTPASMYSINRQGQIVSINRTLLETLGYAEHEVLGHDSSDFMTEESREYTKNMIRPEFFRGGSVYDVPFQFVRKDGKVLDVLLSGIAERAENGEIIRALTVLRDITEQKRAERALHEERNLFVGGPTVVFKNSYQNGPILEYVSPNMKSVFGYSPEQFTTDVSFVMSLIHPDDLPLFRNQMRKMQESPDLSCEQEYRMRHANGEYRWVHEYTSIGRDSDGGISSVRGYLTDITDRKRAEEAQRISEERYRTIVETAAEGICVVDTEGVITFANKTLADGLGLTLNDVIGHPLHEFLYEEDLADHSRMLKQRATGQPGKYERRVRKSDGSTLWCQVSATPLKDAGGRYIGAFAMFTDVTASKLAQSALTQNESKYRALIETTNTGYCIVDDEGCLIDANAEYLRVAGYSDLDEIRGRSVTEWTAPYEKAKNRAAVERCSREGFVRNLEVDYITRDGKITPIEINATLLDADNSPKILALCRDISERRHAEAELRKNEAVLRSIFNATPAGVALLVDRKFLNVNSALCKMTGCTEQELLGQCTSLIYISKEEYVRTGKSLYGQLESQGFASAEAVLKNKSGARIDVLLCLSPFERDHQEMGVTATVLDITDRKRAEEALRQSERLHRSLVDLSPDGIYIYADDGIVFANDAFTRLLKADRSTDLIGLKAKDFVHHDFLEFVASRRQAVQELGVNRCAELRFVRRDGAELDVEVSAVAIEWNSLPAAQVIVRDISDRKRAESERIQLEEQLRLSQKLETIGTLAAGIAHDFNNLLVPIIGYTELVAADRPPDSPESEHLSEVIRAAYRAKGLVAQILSFSRQQAGDKRPLHLSSIVNEVGKLMQSTLGGSVKIVSRIDAGTLPVLADATQIHQVLMNLCVNSSHAMDGGGTLTITLNNCSDSPCVCPGCQRALAGSYVHLSVRDTGCGMSVETKKRIFDPFFTTKPVGEGSGLGLAVSHGIITQHGGHICPESEPGAGATFHIFLPSADRSEATLSNSIPMVERGSESLMVIDDALEVGQATAKTLESLGYRVNVQTSPEHAIKEFEENPLAFDLILTDFRMPGMNGDRLAVELLRIRPEIPILVFSGYSDSLDLRNAHGIGIRDVLTKPVPSQELHSSIRKALVGRRPNAPKAIA